MKLFIDFDNTIANSSEVIVDMLNEHFGKSENFEIVKHILESNSLRDSATKSLVYSPKNFLVPLIKN